MSSPRHEIRLNVLLGIVIYFILIFPGVNLPIPVFRVQNVEPERRILETRNLLCHLVSSYLLNIEEGN